MFPVRHNEKDAVLPGMTGLGGAVPEGGSASPSAALGLSKGLIERGQYEAALEASDVAIAEAPGEPAAWLAKVRALLPLGRGKDAHGVLDAAIDQIGSVAALLREKARLFVIDGDFEGAAQTFGRLTAAEPRSADGWLGTGHSLLAEGRNEEALDCARQAITVADDRMAAFELYGDCLLSLQRWDEAYNAFDAAAAFDPSRFGAPNWAARGDWFWDRAQPELALKSYDRAIASDPDDPLGWYGKANVLKRHDDFDGAIVAYERASRSDPEFILGFLDAGQMCFEREDYARALSLFLQAAEAKSDDARPWTYIGDVHLLQGRFEEALTAYRHATDIEPDDVAVWDRIGRAFVEHNRFEEALTAYERIAAINPNDSDTWNTLGNIQIKLSRLTEALQSYDRAIEADPDYIWPHHNRSFVLYQQGRLNEALQAIAPAIAIDPDCADVLILMLIVLNETTIDEAAADDCADRVLASSGADVRVRLHVAALLADNNRGNRARELLHQVDFTTLENADERLELAELLLKAGENARAAEILRSVDAGKLSGLDVIVRCFLLLLVDRLTGATPHLEDACLLNLLRELEPWAHPVKRDWSFTGLRRLLRRSAISMLDKLALTTLIDVLDGRLDREKLSFFTEMREVRVSPPGVQRLAASS